MTRVKGTSTTAFLISAALISALSGCSLSVTLPSTDSSTPAESTPEVVDESPTPAPESAPLTIGECDDFVSLRQARSLLSPTAVLLEEHPANEYRTWFEEPVVAAAISGLSGGRYCWWGIPNSDSSFVLLVAEIDPATRASVEASLAADGYSSDVTGGVTAYEKAPYEEYRAETHLFTGDVWIVSDGSVTDLTSPVTEWALEAMRAANPTLGL
jgi:hypothetical protein